MCDEREGDPLDESDFECILQLEVDGEMERIKEVERNDSRECDDSGVDQAKESDLQLPTVRGERGMLHDGVSSPLS